MSEGQAKAGAGSGARAFPLRSIEAGALNMDIWVEESNVKAKLPV